MASLRWQWMRVVHARFTLLDYPGLSDGVVVLTNGD